MWNWISEGGLDFSVFVLTCLRAYEGAMSETQDSELFIYPNPAKEKVTIEGIEATEVEVYNALGQRVKMVRGTNEINVSGLPEGVYLLRIADIEGRIFMEKVMVR